MRKYIIGGLVGLAIGLSATAYADDVESLIGQTVQGQTAVYLDGEPLDTAIIVDGKSYAPARKVAEATGNSVTFSEGGIYLQSESETAPDTGAQSDSSSGYRDLAQKKFQIEQDITNTNDQVSHLNDVIKRNEPNLTSKFPEIKDVAQKNIDSANKSLETLQSKLSDLTTQLTDVSNQMNTLK